MCSKFMEHNIISLYKITENGELISTIKYEIDFQTKELISKTSISENTLPETFLKYDPNKLNIPRTAIAENKCKYYQYQEVYGNGDSNEKKPIISMLNIPTMMRCQNCETNFPTKYQYQRHQCEFNADKVILKADADYKSMENGVRIKYDCNTCGKQFVSKNNLNRHQAGHENSQSNICEHCNKQFVSENRLRIHKENHCKKAGDLSKFYRSDVTVWKCMKCHEVFSSISLANFHVESCAEEVITLDGDSVEQTSQDSTTENQNVKKILTEILLQCEFCNRTYADKNLLVAHMKKHTTAKNYECVNCNETFDSFAVASQHWMRKCSEFSNLFCLPKLTYCERCDRTFKSHEVLYTHKIKKKHYKPKKCAEPTNENHQKSNEIKRTFDELIQDVLKTLSLPLNPNNNKHENVGETAEKVDHEEIIENDDKQDKEENKENCNDDMEIKAQQDMEDKSTGKKKRGRKRRLIKPSTANKSKRICTTLENGYKYQCERCIKIFDSIVELDGHREKEHAVIFNCEECGQVLHSARALLIHSRAHKNLKPYVCDACGRSYSQTSHLWQHMRFHQGIKPFACPHEGCEARYTIRPDLKDHIRKVHTRERPFKCNVCNKCFLTGSVYYQHRLIHSNDRRYGCDVCQKRFFRADALNNHKRIHTDERPYPCNRCGREFRQKGDRNKHIRTQHMEVPNNV